MCAAQRSFAPGLSLRLPTSGASCCYFDRMAGIRRPGWEYRISENRNISADLGLTERL